MIVASRDDETKGQSMNYPTLLSFDKDSLYTRDFQTAFKCPILKYKQKKHQKTKKKYYQIFEENLSHKI